MRISRFVKARWRAYFPRLQRRAGRERHYHRLLREVDQWNLASKKGYELSFSYALAPYITGSDAEDVLRAVDRKMYSKKLPVHARILKAKLFPLRLSRLSHPVSSTSRHSLWDP